MADSKPNPRGTSVPSDRHERGGLVGGVAAVVVGSLALVLAAGEEGAAAWFGRDMAVAHGSRLVAFAPDRASFSGASSPPNAEARPIVQSNDAAVEAVSESETASDIEVAPEPVAERVSVTREPAQPPARETEAPERAAAVASRATTGGTTTGRGSGATATLPAPRVGSATISVRGAWANFTVDGGEERQTPGFVELPEGPHVVTLYREGFRTIVDTIHVRGGARVERVYTLQSGGGG